MKATNPQLEQGIVEAGLEGSISDEAMDHHLAEAHDEINALLQAAYDAKERGEFAPLEPLPVLLAEERARFNANRG